ncbi:hemagglutinin repeat-containing protein [Limnohabitans sp. T6-20]|uniref:hemagglutinin repeat-containing protein n=1 Tax=Limnohabitans sp. T6-20 TaxID=1100725 RepID=UPI000D351F7B|nr:hemagglutinin repeat-containing protein [Limnohabitans sp. T6-20]PUE12944.1 hypothetical protein B9Z33_05545 [Limnohabitans sp. T6-20]
MQSQLQAAGNTSSGRMQALAGANAAMILKQAVDAVKAGQGDAKGQVPTGNKNPDGTPETKQGNAADKAGGIGISLSVGSSSSQSKQSSSADNARGSSINAGGNITIQAPGAGQNSNLTVQGSSVQAAGTTRLQADNQVNLLAAQNTTSESSSNQSKSGSVGVAAQLGNGGGGIGFTASASKATGQGAGNGVTYTNTQVAGNTVNIESGGDTTLKGAVVKANQVTADVGGNLSIQSLQDQNQYKESSKSAGGSIMVGAGVSGSINVAKSSINSTYTSVNEQSAIRAGDGGFQVEVKGNTTLTGAQITSTQAAIDNNKDNNKNSFQTGGTLTTTDLQNKASYEAKSVSVGLGAGALPGKSASAGMSGVGFGSDSGNASSTTTAGISGIAGNTQARTGDKETGIGQVFNKDKVKAEVNAQVAITSEFGKQASKVVGDYAGSQLKDLKKQADTETDPTKKAALQAEAAKWEEGGTNRIALHAVVGGLTGGVQGAVGAGAASAAAPGIDPLQGQLKAALKDAGMNDSAANVIAGLAGGGAAAAVGAAASGGSTAGGATAFNADMNNRQLHSTEVQKAKELAAKSGGKYKQSEIEEQMRLMGNTATAELSNTTTVLTNTDAIVNSLNNDPSMPKIAQGNVVVEVPGKANPELQNWIISNTTQGADYIPGQSPYINSNAALNGPKLTTDVKVNAPTAAVANNDVAGKSGVGVQQNAPLTQQARETIADAASDVSRQAGVIGAAATAATGAASPQIKPLTGSVAVGATVIGVAADVIEQVARPDLGVTTTNTAGTIVQTAVERIPGSKAVTPITNELIEMWKNSGSARSIQDWINERFGGKTQ